MTAVSSISASPRADKLQRLPWADVRHFGKTKPIGKSSMNTIPPFSASFRAEEHREPLGLASAVGRTKPIEKNPTNTASVVWAWLCAEKPRRVRLALRWRFGRT
jgi:hypothetical protein